MARVTVEDCLVAVGNHFALAILGAARARELARGAPSLVECDNKPGVTALREIAEGKVRFNESLLEVIQKHIESTKKLDGARRPHRHGGATDIRTKPTSAR